jgi:hypothetical protein
MLYVGMNLSRKRLDWCAAWSDAAQEGVGAVSPHADALARLGGQLRRVADEVVPVIASMNGADQLDLAGWDVRIADALRAMALAPLACRRIGSALGVVRVWPARSDSRDLASRPRGAGGPRAGAFPDALGQAPIDAEKPRRSMIESGRPVAAQRVPLSLRGTQMGTACASNGR